jgi:hypothetical protein
VGVLRWHSKEVNLPSRTRVSSRAKRPDTPINASPREEFSNDQASKCATRGGG